MKNKIGLGVLFFIALVSLSGCNLIDGIFKTGIGIGIFIAVIIILLIFVISRLIRKG